jgi:hypothetical protein
VEHHFRAYLVEHPTQAGEIADVGTVDRATGNSRQRAE